MVKTDIKTEFGKVMIHGGYYTISSRKEGNHGKKLHRLIYEKYFGPIPEGFVIHHRDGNKLNNNLDNLVMLHSIEHNRLHMLGEKNHMYGRHFNLSEEHKNRISESHKGKIQTLQHNINSSRPRNISGIFRVHKFHDEKCRNKFRWRYSYSAKNKIHEIKRVNLCDLEREVKKRGLPWICLNEISMNLSYSLNNFLMILKKCN